MNNLHFTKEQRQILDIQKMYPDTGVCNIGGMLTQSCSYDWKNSVLAAEYAINDILATHIQLHCDYEPYIEDSYIKIEDWDAESEPSDSQLAQWVDEPFELFDSPLCELRFWKGDTTKIYLKVHHVLLDGYSILLVLKRYEDYCERISNGCYERLEPDSGYLALMKEENINSPKEVQWFREHVPTVMPDNWRVRETACNDITAKRKKYEVTSELYGKIAEFSRKVNVTVESIFYSALGIYGHRTTGVSPVCFGRVMLNRRKKHMEMAGLMANQMPFFMDCQEEEFAGICHLTNNDLLRMMRYSSASFAEYQRENATTNRYYDIAVSYRNDKLVLKAHGAKVYEIEKGLLEIPLRLDIQENDGGLCIYAQYQTASYTELEVDLLIARVLYIIEQGINGKNKKEISLLTDVDRRCIGELNSKRDYKVKEELILPQIEKFAHQGDRCALVYNDRSVSYEEMWRNADKIAMWLSANGVGKSDIVAIQLPVSENLPEVMLGVWKAGAAFLPVSIHESARRVEEIKNDCNIYFSEEELHEAVSFDGKCKLPEIEPEMLAYCMYTSGSTGKPKLVMITHRSLSWRVNWMTEEYGNPGAVLQKTAYTFDVSMWEFFWPLISGERLVLLPDAARANPREIAEAIERNKINTIHFVPTVLERFIAYAEFADKDFSGLRHAFSSGEALQASTAKRFCTLFDAALHNLYGPTECTIDVTSYNCSGDEEVIPIGRPLPGCDIEIVDKYGRCVPPEVEGELIVGGVLVGAGYKDADTDKFFYDEEKGESRYRTGDRAVLKMDGQIYYCGRADSQCKIHGMRVELAQIEDAMLSVAEITSATVINANEQLIGCYVAEKEVSEIAEKISGRLPAYSVPQRYVRFAEFPVTQNGKIDKSKILETIATVRNQSAYDECENEEEALLLEMIREKTGNDVSPDENVFLAGLDSLKVIDIILAMEKKGYEYNPEDFYEHKTVKKIVRNKKSSVQWLTRKKRENLIVAFPYAAGNAEAYQELAEALAGEADFCVTRSVDVAQTARQYEKVVLMGYCTGTVIALEAYQQLVSDSITPCGLVLCAAVPPGKIIDTFGTPGEVLPESGVAKFIQMLHRKKVPVTHNMVDMFRRDSRHFSQFFKDEHKAVKCKKILLCFGRNDMLTKNSAHSWRRWRKYVQGSTRLVIFAKQHHFFLNEKKNELANEITKLF